MTCFSCKGDVEPTLTTYMTHMNSCYIIIKNVPCQQWTQCGEEYLSGTTLKKIETIIEKLQAALTEVAVVDYSNAA